MTDRLQTLEELVQCLRSPDGCPWDREQNLNDLRAYLLEEAHETAAAMDKRNFPELEGELGDLLFLVVFVATVAAEEGAASLSEIVERARAKMIARHPHVFGSERLEDADAVRGSWERRKLAQSNVSLLEGIPSSLPALLATYRMTQKAAGVGFDWSDPAQVLDKIDEEIVELRHALEDAEPQNSPEVLEEIGDLFFTVANLSRKLKLDPEAALSSANRKFRSRFEFIEKALRNRGQSVDDVELEELEVLWKLAKAAEKPTNTASSS